MTDINKIFLIGRLVRDAEVKNLPSGTALCQFSIAVNRSYKKNNEWVNEVSYFECILWGQYGQKISEYLKKGKQVAIAGSLKQDRWNDGGNTRSKVKIVCDAVQLIGGKVEQKVDFQDDDIPY